MNASTPSIAMRDPISNTSTAISRLLKLALPMAMGMLVNGLYAIVDAIFIAHYAGVLAFAAVSAVFPLYIALIALATMISNGTSIRLSQAYGEDDKKKANQTLSAALVLILCFSLVTALIGFTSVDGILCSLGLTVTLQADAHTYLSLILIGASVIFYLSLAVDYLKAKQDGKSLLITILIGAALNLLLDYLLIAHFQLGVRGAALATLLAQAGALLYALKCIRAANFSVASSCGGAPLSSVQGLSDEMRKIIVTGLPVFITYFGAAMVMMTVNYTLALYAASEHSFALYGAIGRISTFIILPLMALTQASQTLVAFHFGAKRIQALTHLAKAGYLTAFVYLTLIWLAIWTQPAAVLGVFLDVETLTPHDSAVLRLVLLALPLSAISSMSVSLLQACNMSTWASLIAIGKLYLLLIPGVVIAAKIWGLNAIWYVFPIAEVLIITTLGLLYTRVLKTRFAQHMAQPLSQAMPQSLQHNTGKSSSCT